MNNSKSLSKLSKITTDEEYDQALKRVEELFDVSDEKSPEMFELKKLVDLVVEYEKKQYKW